MLAYLGDNDLALGRVVEGLSKSRFWKHMAIFVVEDDAQNGSDHVDAHRTVALAISPYIKRKSVDSTMYSTSSMLRTMELCLGLEPMSQFDAAARPMWRSFTSTPDLAPYTHRPAQALDDTNAASAPLAAESSKHAAARPRRTQVDRAAAQRGDLEERPRVPTARCPRRRVFRRAAPRRPRKAAADRISRAAAGHGKLVCRFRFTLAPAGDPEHLNLGDPLKSDIHPTYVDTR